MYALLLALLSGGIAGGLSHVGGLSQTWSIVIGMAAFLAVTITVSQITRIKIKKINADIQQVMEETRHKITMMQNQFMRRPLGSQKMMLQALEKEQNAGIRREGALKRDGAKGRRNETARGGSFSFRGGRRLPLVHRLPT